MKEFNLESRGSTQSNVLKLLKVQKQNYTLHVQSPSSAITRNSVRVLRSRARHRLSMTEKIFCSTLGECAQGTQTLYQLSGFFFKYCYLPVFLCLYESFWKGFEADRRRFTLPVSNVFVRRVVNRTPQLRLKFRLLLNLGR